MVSDPHPDRSSLVRRLRGIYTIPVNDGAGLLNGDDIFTRSFDVQNPLQSQAAQLIEDLENGMDFDKEFASGIIRELLMPRIVFGPVPFVSPISREAAERIIELTGLS